MPKLCLEGELLHTLQVDGTRVQHQVEGAYHQGDDEREAEEQHLRASEQWT